MAASTIDEILKERRRKGGGTSESIGEDPAKFYSVLSAEGLQENFLEIRFQDGLRTCFAYADLSWFNYDPSSCFAVVNQERPSEAEPLACCKMHKTGRRIRNLFNQRLPVSESPCRSRTGFVSGSY